jgi:hypothetical protein
MIELRELRITTSRHTTAVLDHPVVTRLRIVVGATKCFHVFAARQRNCSTAHRPASSASIGTRRHLSTLSLKPPNHSVPLDKDQSTILFFRKEWKSNDGPLTSIHSTPHYCTERSQSRRPSKLHSCGTICDPELAGVIWRHRPTATAADGWTIICLLRYPRCRQTGAEVLFGADIAELVRWLAD